MLDHAPSSTPTLNVINIFAFCYKVTGLEILQETIGHKKVIIVTLIPILSLFFSEKTVEIVLIESTMKRF